MTAFHAIAIPHDDILQGRLTMDVFAADLWEVFKGRDGVSGIETWRTCGYDCFHVFFLWGIERGVTLVEIKRNATTMETPEQ